MRGRTKGARNKPRDYAITPIPGVIRSLHGPTRGAYFLNTRKGRIRIYGTPTHERIEEMRRSHEAGGGFVDDYGGCPHVTEFIQEELDARGWSRAELANRMGMDACVRNLLVLDTLFAVGPTHTNCRLGQDTADRLGRAFDVSADLFLNLERAWLASMGDDRPLTPRPHTG